MRTSDELQIEQKNKRKIFVKMFLKKENTVQPVVWMCAVMLDGVWSFGVG
jgi:fumarate reductase subunit C